MRARIRSEWAGTGLVLLLAMSCRHQAATQQVITEAEREQAELEETLDAVKTLSVPSSSGGGSRPIKYAQRTEIDFEDLDVSGELVKPSGALVLDRRRSGPPRSPTPVVAPDGAASPGPSGRVHTSEDPPSTFSIDVDTASWAIARRSLRAGQAPPPAAVRVEEFVNAQRYDYPDPGEEGPFSVVTEVVDHPFVRDRHLLKVALQGVEATARTDAPVQLTFLVDVSCSMRSEDKLPLAKRSLNVLVDQLGPSDRVAIATYAGATEVVLEPTAVADAPRIRAAIDALAVGGGTAMHSGLDLAYDLAMETLRPNQESRVVVLSDGDANLGPTTTQAMLDTIAARAAQGITLSVVGLGTGNYQDHRMERLADAGDGNYSYLDSFTEAKRRFGRDMAANLHTIARDVKLQVAFDPAAVRSYRLLGYENRAIADADFRDDRVDAGEVGPGHSVTALYELELLVDSGERLGEVRLRWERPGSDTEASERTLPIQGAGALRDFEAASADTQIAVAAAALAEKLRSTPEADRWSWDRIQAIARGAHRGSLEDDELVELVGRAQAMEERHARR